MRLIYFFTFILIAGTMTSQEELKVKCRYLVKQNFIIFRIAPINANTFRTLSSGTIEVTRSEHNNGLPNGTIPVKYNVKPYDVDDTLNWMKLFREDKNKGAFAYTSLYSSSNTQRKRENEDAMIKLLLLTSDISKNVAKAAGLYFIDSLVFNDRLYDYVFVLKKDKISKTILSLQVDASILSPNVCIRNVTGKCRNKITEIKWNAAELKSNFSAYNVERSEDSINFHRINRIPIVFVRTQFEKNKQYIFYSDTVRKINQKYYYRVKGIDFFGEESDASNSICCYSAPEVKSFPEIDTLNLNCKGACISWRMKEQSDSSAIREYLLLRSSKDNGSYQLINKKKHQRYLDTTIEETSYYKVAAVCFNTDTIYSHSRIAVFIDSIPPLPPAGLTAVIDKKGLVTLRWQRNKENDLQGYKLFRANSRNEELVQINNKFITDTFYTDKTSLKTLSKHVFYAVSASDKNYNASLTGFIVTVKRPDTIPPAKPLIAKAEFKKNTVRLEYIPSSSEDVKEHVVYRKLLGDNEFKLVEKITRDSVSLWADTSVNAGDYLYKIFAIDSSGNKSVSNEHFVSCNSKFQRPIENFYVNAIKSEKCIELKWEYSTNQVEKFIIYRNKPGEPSSPLKVLKGDLFTYKDDQVEIGKVYEYRIKAVFLNGTESIMSQFRKASY